MSMISVQIGYFEQPQNCFPACLPFLAVRITIVNPHEGHKGPLGLLSRFGPEEMAFLEYVTPPFFGCLLTQYTQIIPPKTAMINTNPIILYGQTPP